MNVKSAVLSAILAGIFLGSGSPGASASSIGSLTLTAVKARIFTPNGDGHNDKARFEFDNPELLPLAGAIYDLSGARVAELAPAALDPYAALLWDGKDDGGQAVPGGMYLYQIDFQGEKATGTVVLAQ